MGYEGRNGSLTLNPSRVAICRSGSTYGIATDTLDTGREQSCASPQPPAAEIECERGRYAGQATPGRQLKTGG